MIYGAIEKSADYEAGCNTAPETTAGSNSPSGKGHKRNYLLVIGGVIATAAIGLVGVSLHSSSFSLVSTTLSEDNTLAVQVTNEYGDYMRRLFSYPFLENSLLLEPYRDTTFTITNSASDCSYSWALAGDDFEAEGTSTTGVFETNVEKPGKYILTISESCDSSGSTREVEQDIYVKYIRRELTSLSVKDREDFLDAFHTLWTTSTVDGQAIYGERYKSVHFFATIHNDAGGNPLCDQFHGDVGFANNHLFLGQYLEQSLQLINPKISLNYMDYSKYFSNGHYDEHMKNQLDGGLWTDLLTDKWFGSSDPSTGQILDGRWAETPVPTLTQEFFQLHGVAGNSTFFPIDEPTWRTLTDAHISSPYGLLRAPWNHNPSEYLVRYNNVHGIKDATEIDSDVFIYYRGVTCDDYSEFIESVKGGPLQRYLQDAEDSVHGIVHFTFGGQSGDYSNTIIDKLKKSFGFTDEHIVVLSQSSQTFFKYYIGSREAINPDETFPLVCSSKPWKNDKLSSAAGPGEPGGPSCQLSGYYLDDEDNLNSLIEEFFSIDPSTDNSIKDFINTFDLERKKELMSILANLFPYDGDMAGSGAALDPLFWVAHGAVERLFQYSVFKGWMTDYVYNQTLPIPCSGHVAGDPKAWLNGYYLLDESIDVSSLSNTDLTAILDPQGDGYRDLINYVYDVSDYAWCDEARWEAAEVVNDWVPKKKVTGIFGQWMRR